MIVEVLVVNRDVVVIVGVAAVAAVDYVVVDREIEVVFSAAVVFCCRFCSNFCSNDSCGCGGCNGHW